MASVFFNVEVDCQLYLYQPKKFLITFLAYYSLVEPVRGSQKENKQEKSEPTRSIFKF